MREARYMRLISWTFQSGSEQVGLWSNNIFSLRSAENAERMMSDIAQYIFLFQCPPKIKPEAIKFYGVLILCFNAITVFSILKFTNINCWT
jgi:hypothetical protein